MREKGNTITPKSQSFWVYKDIVVRDSIVLRLFHSSLLHTPPVVAAGLWFVLFRLPTK